MQDQTLVCDGGGVCVCLYKVFICFFLSFYRVFLDCLLICCSVYFSRQVYSLYFIYLLYFFYFFYLFTVFFFSSIFSSSLFLTVFMEGVKFPSSSLLYFALSNKFYVCFPRFFSTRFLHFLFFHQIFAFLSPHFLSSSYRPTCLPPTFLLIYPNLT